MNLTLRFNQISSSFSMPFLANFLVFIFLFSTPHVLGQNGFDRGSYSILNCDMFQER